MNSISTKTQRISTASNKSTNKNNENKKSFFEKLKNNKELEILNLIQRKLKNELDLDKVTTKITQAQIKEQEKKKRIKEKEGY
jgi:hypothetical protein